MLQCKPLHQDSFTAGWEVGNTEKPELDSNPDAVWVRTARLGGRGVASIHEQSNRLQQQDAKSNRMRIQAIPGFAVHIDRGNFPTQKIVYAPSDKSASILHMHHPEMPVKWIRVLSLDDPSAAKKSNMRHRKPLRSGGLSRTTEYWAEALRVQLPRQTAMASPFLARPNYEDNLPTWIRALYEEGLGEPSVEVVQGILLGCSDLIRHGQWTIMDQILSSIEVDRLHPQSLNGLLRAPFKFRDKLPSWAILLKRTETSLRTRNENVRDWLWGLHN